MSSEEAASKLGEEKVDSYIKKNYVYLCSSSYISDDLPKEAREEVRILLPNSPLQRRAMMMLDKKLNLDNIFD